MANPGISHRDRDAQYFRRHSITAEANVDVSPDNVIQAAANTVVQIFPNDAGSSEIVLRQLQNQGTDIVYISISEFEPLDATNVPNGGALNTPIPSKLRNHYAVAVGVVLDLSRFDNDIYANCPSAPLIVSTVLIKRV